MKDLISAITLGKTTAANLRLLKDMKNISLLCLLLLILSGSRSRSVGNDKEVSEAKEYVFRLLPQDYNPRNSEGDFIALKDGRILFIYTHYTVVSGDDHAIAYLAGRYSTDNGKTWSAEDLKIVEQEGKMNVMSVSLLRLQNGEIALFYLRKNSVTDCIPVIRISDDEAKTSPCSPASITRIPATGDLLLVWNDNGTDQKRTPFNIAFSNDEGKSWHNNKILEDNPEGSFCYPVIHYPDKELLISFYDWSTLGSTIIKINLDWIYRE